MSQNKEQSKVRIKTLSQNLQRKVERERFLDLFFDLDQWFSTAGPWAESDQPEISCSSVK